MPGDALPFFTVQQIIVPLFLVLLGYLAGFTVERVFLKGLARGNRAALGRDNKIIVTSLRGITTLWCTLIGAYVAIISTPISSDAMQQLLHLLEVPFILSLTLFSMRLSGGFIDYYEKARGRTGSTVSLWRSLTNSIILIIGVLIVLQSLGISITPIITALGITGVVVSLALQDTLSNVFAGLYIVFSRQTQPGDYVRLKVDERDHVEGYITDINWRSTKIRMPPTRMSIDPEPSMVNVPNSRMASDIVIIHHRATRELEILVDVGVGYGSDLERVERITVDVASAVLRDTLGWEPIFKPIVRYRAFSLAGIDLTVVLYAGEAADRHLIVHELIKRLYKRYQQEGITLVPAETPGTSSSRVADRSSGPYWEPGNE